MAKKTWTRLNKDAFRYVWVCTNQECIDVDEEHTTYVVRPPVCCECYRECKHIRTEVRI